MSMFKQTDIYTGEIITPFFRTEWNYDRDKASDESGLACPEPTLTQQSFAEECDINVIVERFGITGELPQIGKVPLQDEFLEATTYQEALNKMMEADTAFMMLPASVRTRFDNDPGKFVEWASHDTEERRQEARDLGLAMPEKKVEIPVVRVMKEDEPKA